MPILVEHFVVVGTPAEIDRGAQLWRFTAAGSASPNPVTIQQAAERGAPLAKVTASWTTGTDPQVHRAATQRLLDTWVWPMCSREVSPPGEQRGRPGVRAARLVCTKAASRLNSPNQRGWRQAHPRST